MLSTKKVYNLISEYVKFNNEYLEEVFGEDWEIDLMYDLTDDQYNENLLLYREFNTEDEVYSALEVEVANLVTIEQQVNEELETKEEEETSTVKSIEQHLLQVMEGIEEDKEIETVTTLNSLYYSKEEDTNTPTLEENNMTFNKYDAAKAWSEKATEEGVYPEEAIYELLDMLHTCNFDNEEELEELVKEGMEIVMEEYEPEVPMTEEEQQEIVEEIKEFNGVTTITNLNSLYYEQEEPKEEEIEDTIDSKESSGPEFNLLVVLLPFIVLGGFIAYLTLTAVKTYRAVYRWINKASTSERGSFVYPNSINSEAELNK